jgi:hypothetical protein
MEWQHQLVSDYIVIDQCLQSLPPGTANFQGEHQFSDTEVLAVYFWGMRDGHRTVNAIHRLAVTCDTGFQTCLATSST